MTFKNRALLVSLSVNKPQLTQKDDKATHDAEVANNAHGAGQFRKDLYPKHLIAPIVAVESSARAYIESQTYMWSRGEYLLPTARFMDFAERMGKFEIEFDQAITAFLNNWGNVLAQAQGQQGSLFDPSAYPDVSSLRSQFRFRWLVRPITDSGDFRVQVSDEAEAIIRARVEADVRESMESVMREPLQRLRETVQRLRETMAKPERTTTDKRTGKTEIKPPIFRDSVVDNIIEEIALLRELADVMPPDIVELADQIKDQVPGPETLRMSADVRKATVTISDSLLARIDEMLG